MTRRTVLGSVFIVLLVAGVIGLLTWALARQHDAAERARRSQAVIAAAHLTHQRLLAVQTNIRGYLISGHEDLLRAYRQARAGLPDAALELATLVEGDPGQERRAAAIQVEALSYVSDYGDAVVARVREDGVAAGRSFAAAAEGSARADALAALVADLTRAEHVLSARHAASADSASRRAFWIAMLGLAACIVALALVTLYVARRIVLPVTRLAGAADRVRRGELDVAVEAGPGEVGRLGAAFNAMAHSLQQSRDELQSQNTELELQAIALEDRQRELAASTDEVRAQRDELSLTAAQLADAKHRAERYGAFADRLAREREAAALGALALSELVSAAGADVGVLYAESRHDTSRWARLAVEGLDPAPLPEHMTAGGEGVAARAVARGEVLHQERSSLRVRTLAGDSALAWELHVPLAVGERVVGVATVGAVATAGTAARSGSDLREDDFVARLAGQAAVALAEAGALAQRNWLFQVNAAVLDGVREGIALVGLDHELVFANAAMEQFAARAALPVAATIGAPGPDPGEFDPEAYFGENWEAVLADSDDPTADELEVGEMVLERYTAPVDDAQGARIGRLVVLRDVTREREVEQLKSELMATVSHELRTPLASVLGYAELLRKRRLDEAARDEILAIVHREAERLSALVDDFLDLQTIEQQQLTLTRVPFDLGALLAESVAVFSGQSLAHKLELAPCPSPILAFGDRARIAQVVANLLSNAIKYSPDGGTVRVVATSAAGTVRVSIADDGLGIPAAQQPRVFERFFRVSRPDEVRVAGTGLGLALAHDIVEAHGGTMGFESVEGDGSTFWFTLPLAS